MGLAERRKIQSAAEGLSDAQAELDKELGFQLPVELQTSSFPEDKDVLYGYDSYKDYGFPMVCRVLKKVGCDDLGKEALREKVTRVAIVNTATDSSNGGEKSVELADGLLTIKLGWYSYSDKLFGEDEMREKIEALL
ncbi:MAG: hypothetical protein KC910_33585 [Candidatus Eremiobacteraeota bacterium]|nr:hypothetical protein [Candidatus Eremiobacteraeota bacterium]